MGAQDHRACGRRAIGLGCRIGSGVFRQGLRRDLSREAARQWRRKTPRKSTATRSGQCPSSPRFACWPGNLTGLGDRHRLSPITLQILGGRMPIQANEPWLSIVPNSGGAQLIQRLACDGVHHDIRLIGRHLYSSLRLSRVAAGSGLGCGFSDPTPAAQYSGGGFAQPIRRVFGTLVFSARDHVEMPPPGDIRPARLRIELHDLIWEGMYRPIAGAVGLSSDD